MLFGTPATKTVQVDSLLKWNRPNFCQSDSLENVYCPPSSSFPLTSVMFYSLGASHFVFSQIFTEYPSLKSILHQYTYADRKHPIRSLPLEDHLHDTTTEISYPDAFGGTVRSPCSTLFHSLPPSSRNGTESLDRINHRSEIYACKSDVIYLPKRGKESKYQSVSINPARKNETS